jgi:hypothetical protein
MTYLHYSRRCSSAEDAKLTILNYQRTLQRFRDNVPEAAMKIFPTYNAVLVVSTAYTPEHEPITNELSIRFGVFLHRERIDVLTFLRLFDSCLINGGGFAFKGSVGLAASGSSGLCFRR